MAYGAMPTEAPRGLTVSGWLSTLATAFGVTMLLFGARLQTPGARGGVRGPATMAEVPTRMAEVRSATSEKPWLRENGWRAVRCVSSTEGSWHPAADMLAGTERYGERASVDEDRTWSVVWDWSQHSEALLALTDASYWLVVSKDQLRNYGGPVQTQVARSSASSVPTETEWYLRGSEDCDAAVASGKPLECSEAGAKEDPWASVYDHSADEGGYVYGGNAMTGHLEHLGQNGVGACVWVR